MKPKLKLILPDAPPKNPYKAFHDRLVQLQHELTAAHAELQHGRPDESLENEMQDAFDALSKLMTATLDAAHDTKFLTWK